MNKESYLNEIEKRLRLLFKASKEGYKSSPTQRHRLEGFMQAGAFLGLANNAELKVLMEAVHLEIFHKSISERKVELAGSWDNEVIDYSQYEQPTFERKNS